ncbi:hypothetical protein Q672_06750 [Marinobacter sp. EVN1]|jgi:hypothetical protein|nr:hypothetical protein Q672_06750 [Marinobacter sp. EVN1]
MRTLALIGVLFAFAMGSAAHAEGVSAEDIECGNNATCIPNLEEGNGGSTG